MDVKQPASWKSSDHLGRAGIVPCCSSSSTTCAIYENGLGGGGGGGGFFATSASVGSVNVSAGIRGNSGIFAFLAPSAENGQAEFNMNPSDFKSNAFVHRCSPTPTV